MARLQHRQTVDPVVQARRAFFESGRAPAGYVPPAILQSWRRCLGLGLAVNARPSIEPVDAPRLRALRERHEHLWRLARAEVEILAGDAANAGSIVILTDADGWILDAEGNAGFLDKAGRVALMPGACWSEAQVGTNAIGTAIAEGAAVEVRGAEHYANPHRILNCSAAPVFDPWGMLVGVLDISGDASVASVHALGLAQLAVANIEHRYFDEGIADADLLRVHANPALLGSAREGLLAFRNGRLVAANRAGLALFGLDRTELGKASYEAIFDGAVSHLREDGWLHDRNGRLIHGRVDAPSQARRARATQPITVTPAAIASDTDAPLFSAAQKTELERACRVLDAGIPVLVLGETGTGKEVFARALHRRSARSGKPFVAVNCAALPEGLIEAELFGYESGAFTGARKEGSAGLLRQADGGVLFLDEIGDMPLALQPRLLRVLQDRELTPLGGGRPVKLDFALICATHRRLEEAVAEGRFRADLYYRISHYLLELPPLRELDGREEVVRELWARIGRDRRLSPEAADALAGYGWPGNLRQLVASLRTLAALSEPGSILGVESLPAYLHQPRAGMSTVAPGPTVADTGLDALTRTAMRAAIEACDGNIVRAARQLGISRSTLYRRLGGSLRD